MTFLIVYAIQTGFERFCFLINVAQTQQNQAQAMRLANMLVNS